MLFKKYRKIQYNLIKSTYQIEKEKYMTFGEKLLKLRKEKGFSQEALAEQLGTTRQAISKWENNQGFPETEKLLQLSNIFGISTDFLLKEEKSSNGADEHGYYVSKEMATGYLTNQRKVNRCIGFGFMFWAITGIPFVMFPFNQTLRFLGMEIFIVIGIVAFVVGAISEQEQYKILKEEPLIFDRGYLKDLSDEFHIKKKIYNAILIPSTVLFIVGIIAISFTMQGTVIWSEYHAFIFLGFAIGLFGFCYCAGIIDSYELLIKNEEYCKRLLFKIKRKVKDRIAKL